MSLDLTANFADQFLESAPSEKARISVVGLGYVGAVSTACLASLGHEVIGVDISQIKVDQISRGVSPIHEKDLGKYLSEGVEAGMITASRDLARAVRDSDVTFVSVGTPTAPDGGCDDSCIRAAAKEMADGLRQKNGFHVFAMRCSIPPGTTLRIMAPILEELSGKVLGRDFGVCFNPEFLREGVAIADFYNPPKTVIGATDPYTASILRDILAPVDSDPIVTTIETAEMVKYVDNVWHATKVCFANEIGRLCKPHGVDSHKVMDIFARDTKLNLSPYYLKPGFAYGGSCLPKEVRAVTHMAKAAGVDLPMIGNLDLSNKLQISEACKMVQATGAARVALLGVAFKPGTDDLRESPALDLIAQLSEAGCEVVAHDAAITAASDIEGQLAYVKHGSAGLRKLAPRLSEMLKPDAQAAIENSEVIIVCHASAEYRQLLRGCRKQIIDLVRLFPETPEDIAVNGIGW